VQAARNTAHCLAAMRATKCRRAALAVKQAATLCRTRVDQRDARMLIR